MKKLIKTLVMIPNPATTSSHKTTSDANRYGNIQFGQKYQQQIVLRLFGILNGVCLKSPMSGAKIKKFSATTAPDVLENFSKNHLEGTKFEKQSIEKNC